MKEKKWDLEKIGTYVFYVAVMLETLFVLLDKSAYILQNETWDFRITFLLFAFKIATTKYSVKEWATMILFGIIGVISFFVTDREEMIRAVAIIAACKNVDMAQVMKVIFYETLLGCLVIAGLSLLGIGGDVAITTLYRGGGIEEKRYCFGMGHPNALHCMFFAVILLGLYTYHEKLQWWGYLILAMGNVGLFLLTDSNTGVVIVFFAILLFVAVRYIENIEQAKWPYLASGLLLLVAIGFTILAGTGGEWEYPWILPINRLLNGRLQLSFMGGGVAQWKLFSHPDTWVYFDMGWMRLFYWYGIIPAVCFFAVVSFTIWQCYQHKDIKSVIVLDVFIAYTVLEAHAISVYLGRNYMLFIIGMYWTSMLYRKEKKENLNNESRV